MSNYDLENSLGVLKLLSEALTLPRSLDEGLEHITGMTCELMDTSQAAFLFRDEERKELIVKSAVGIQGRRISNGGILHVPERLKSILWRMRNMHRMNWVDSGIDGICFPILVAPICVKGVRVGVLVTGGTKNQTNPPFGTVSQNLFSLIASFASLVIENAKVYDLLKQHFAVNSPELRQLGCCEGEACTQAEQYTVNSLNNPTKVVKILAESFYKELKRAGFDNGNIASAAAQMLDCLVKDNS